MSSRLKLAGICFAAAFVLAACGGGGSPLDAVKAERDRLAEQLAQVTAARDAAQARVTQLTSDLADRQAELDTANADLMAKQTELDTANADLMAARTALDTANADLMAKQTELDTANADLMAKQTALDNAQAEVDRLEASGTATQAELDTANANLMTAQSDLTTAQGDVTRLMGELADAQGDVTRLEGELADAQGDVTRLEGELADAQADVTRLTNELAMANAELMAANAVNGLFASAQTSRASADAAVMAAGAAVDNAVKYAGMLDVASVKGNSAMAAANAQAVLTAEAAANQAVMDAEAAQMAAESALADAMALADSATKTGLVAALEAAVEHAKAQVTAAKAARDNNPMTEDDPPVVTPAVDSLAEAVAAVTGGENADPQGTPKGIGDGVAMQVAMALLPQADEGEATPDGTATRVTHYATQTALDGATPPAVADRTFHMNDSEGMTWEQIMGTLNVAVMDVRRLVGGSIVEVKAASVDGRKLSDFPTGGTPPTEGDNADGFTFDTTRRGIAGSVFCGGSDCELDDGNLTGSWYFTPTNPDGHYILNPDATARATTEYVQHTAFAQWGHWLVAADHDSDAATPDQVTIHTYAVTGANTENLNVGVATGCDPECSASYSGSAAGMSVHKTYDGDGNQLTIDSGAFTARVSLTARFGTAPMLSGTVDQFRGGPQVDSAWSVTLRDTAIDTTTAAVTGGVAKGSGQAGDWAAQGYGPAQTPAEGANPAVNHRPDGFIGNFNAHFTDGHAAGAFVTE